MKPALRSVGIGAKVERQWLPRPFSATCEGPHCERPNGGTSLPAEPHLDARP